MLKSLKNIIFNSLDTVGLPNLFLKLRNQPRIFLYHGVSPEIPDCGIFNYRRKFIRPESFRNHLIWLKTHFEILPLSLIIERTRHKERIMRPACAITFDDGYGNLYSQAFPVLKELNIPASVFITTDPTDKKIPLWVDVLEYAIGMTKSPEIEVKSMKKKFALKSYAERCAADDAIRNYLKKLPEEKKLKILKEVVSSSGNNLEKEFASSPYQGLTWEEAREMEKNGIEFAPHTLSHPVLSRVDTQTAKKEIK